MDKAVVSTFELIQTIILPLLRNGTCTDKMLAVKLLLKIKERVLNVEGKFQRDMVLYLLSFELQLASR